MSLLINNHWAWDFNIIVGNVSGDKNGASGSGVFLEGQRGETGVVSTQSVIFMPIALTNYILL